MGHPYRAAGLVKKRSLLGPWVQDNVAASQAGVALKRAAAANTGTEGVSPRPGSVTGIAAAFTVAPAGTDLVLQVTKNGTPVSGCILTVAAGATLGRSAVFKASLYNFIAGDRLGVIVTTGAGWTATTSDVVVDVEIETA